MTKISVFVYNQLRGCQRPKYLSLAKISLEGANDQSGCLLGTSSLKDAKKQSIRLWKITLEETKNKVFACEQSAWGPQ